MLIVLLTLNVLNIWVYEENLVSMLIVLGLTLKGNEIQLCSRICLPFGKSKRGPGLNANCSQADSERPAT